MADEDADAPRGDADRNADRGPGSDATSDGETAAAESGGTGSADPRRCDYCRLPCPEEPVTAVHDGEEYRFCSAACRDAVENSDRVFTQYHDYRRFDTGLSALDETLPQGVPRNAFVLLEGQAGTRQRAVHAELVWRTLQRGEPVVIVSFTEPPVSVVAQFLSLDWNVVPYLESGQLNVVDCFTYRLDDPSRFADRLSEWNRHVQSVAERATEVVRDPTDLAAVMSALDDCLERLGMVERGVVVVDSLTELGTLVQPVRSYNFVKDVRADVCKGRFVPVFAGATYAGAEEFPFDMEYVVDGIVDMELAGDVVPNALVKRVRVRKLSDVLAIPEWSAYEYTSRDGMVAFDPEAELEAARGRTDPPPGERGSVRERDAPSGDAETANDPADDADAGRERAPGTDPAGGTADEDA